MATGRAVANQEDRDCLPSKCVRAWQTCATRLRAARGTSSRQSPMRAGNVPSRSTASATAGWPPAARPHAVDDTGADEQKPARAITSPHISSPSSNHEFTTGRHGGASERWRRPSECRSPRRARECPCCRVPDRGLGARRPPPRSRLSSTASTCGEQQRVGGLQHRMR